MKGRVVLFRKESKSNINYKMTDMEYLHPELRLIIEMFPKQKEKISDLYKQDSDFRSLCADYYLCKKTLLDLQKQFSEKENNIEEYEYVRIDLEQELYRSIYNP